MGDEDSNVYERLQFGIVTEVKFLLDDNGQPTDVFSGFVSVRLFTSMEAFGWVRWCNPAISQFNNYGVVVCPTEGDVVSVEFDPRGFAFVTGMLLYSQAAKANFDQRDFGASVQEAVGSPQPKEADDVRLKLKKGELMVRGKNGSSIHFRNDLTTIFKLDDTKTDAATTSISVDKDGNAAILGAKNVTVVGSETASVTCKNAEVKADQKVTVTATDAEVNASNSAKVKTTDATVEASNVTVKSDNILLGKTGSEAPILRNTDKSMHIDPVIGVPVFTQKYVSNSNTTKAK